MEDLIAALTIFLKYGNDSFPTHCEHDVLYITGIDPADVSAEDVDRLDELHFVIDPDMNVFRSTWFGSS